MDDQLMLNKNAGNIPLIVEKLLKEYKKTFNLPAEAKDFIDYVLLKISNKDTKVKLNKVVEQYIKDSHAFETIGIYALKVSSKTESEQNEIINNFIANFTEIHYVSDAIQKIYKDLEDWESI